MNGKIVSLVENQIKKLVDGIRPPIDIRDKLDIGYSFKNNTLEIFEIRPKWDNKDIIKNYPFAKYTKSKLEWTIYWMRASGKWERYEPKMHVNSIDEFFTIITDDDYGCFFG